MDTFLDIYLHKFYIYIYLNKNNKTATWRFKVRVKFTEFTFNKTLGDKQ